MATSYKGVEDAYRRKNDAIDQMTGATSAEWDANRQDIRDSAAGTLRDLYLQNERAKETLKQRNKAAGITGGAAESSRVALEANYDYNMLMTGPYPYYLKTRIASQRGHLCNEENAATLVRLLENGCERFALCHISQENNTPELALESVRAALLGAGVVPGRDCVVNAARRHEVSPIIEF